MPVLTQVASLVDTLATQPVQIERQGNKTQNQYGAWEPGPIVTFTVRPVVVHNASPRDLLEVPEADRNSEIIKVIAREGSFPASQESGFRVADNGYQSDIVIYRGRRFRMVGSRDFVEQGNVWIGLASLEDRQARL